MISIWIRQRNGHVFKSLKGFNDSARKLWKKRGKKNLEVKEESLVTSILSFSHNIFLILKDEFTLWIWNILRFCRFVQGYAWLVNTALVLDLYSPTILQSLLDLVLQIFLYIEAFESNTNSDWLNLMV